ncbi:MAG TPA: alkaline phosphatase family protein [Bacteroidota bacterium]|nr:alkaline phosphatase family protein [Bacteroidota bacterium]
MKYIFVLLVPFFLFAQTPTEKDNRILLPNGWSVSPVGEHIEVGDLPLNAALTSDEKYLAITHSGQSKAEVMLVDVKARKVVQSVQLKDTWLGIKFHGKNLYVSGGTQNCVYSFRLRNGRLASKDSIILEEPFPKYNGSVAGLDVRQGKLAVVLRNDSTLRYYDFKTKHHEKVKLDGMPYSCTYLKDGTLLVSIWSSKKIVVFKNSKFLYELATGDHPTEIAVSDNMRQAFVGNANENSVTVFDLRAKTALATVNTAIYPDSPEGSTTNSVALARGNQVLLAANADNNSLAVISLEDPKRPTPQGFVPVGWYPTKVLALQNNTILVLNGKGGRSLANPRNQYIGSLFKGTLSFIKYPRKDQLLDYTKRVYENTPYKPEHLVKSMYEKESPIPRRIGDPSPIKYVFYIIKENRTYDQVFGDMSEGNGDSTLCLFGEQITPNHHKLARQFVLFDNLYVNAEVSADGHNWSTAAYATDYVEKLWPTLYGGRGGAYDFEGAQPTATPKAGYIWDACARANVSYRSYGEFTEPGETQGEHSTTLVKGLEGHFSPTYRGWDMSYSDIDRVKDWEKEFTEFEKNGGLPQFNIIRLPNDHTEGTRKGKLTPQAYVAQNDYALGLLVERIAKSRFWEESAIFVIEDDAQDGPDHVDAHRTVGLVISPYTRRKFIDNTLYATTSMLRTMELILGLPPMSQYDAASTPMFNAFTLNADTSRYIAEKPRYDVTRRNKDGDYGQVLMEGMNLAKEDAAPDRLFNEIIWRSIKGTPMPPPRYSIFSGSSKRNDD